MRENYTSSKATRPSNRSRTFQEQWRTTGFNGSCKGKQNTQTRRGTSLTSSLCVNELQKGFQWLPVLVIRMCPPSSGSQFTGHYSCLSLTGRVHSKWIWKYSVEHHKGLEMAKSTRMQLSFCSPLRRAGRVTSGSQIGVKQDKICQTKLCVLHCRPGLFSLLSVRLFTDITGLDRISMDLAISHTNSANSANSAPKALQVWCESRPSAAPSTCSSSIPSSKVEQTQCVSDCQHSI